MSENGKGDWRRPQRISDEEFTTNWNRIFQPTEPQTTQPAAEVIEDTSTQDGTE